MTKSTRARYTLEFKEEAVRLVAGGERVAAVARNPGLSRYNALSWMSASEDFSNTCIGRKCPTRAQGE